MKGVSVTSTRTGTMRDTNLMPRLRTIAPGRSPASSSTWKPLQIPRTGPPRSANLATAGMIGEKRAIAPVRR